jgi:hypothetical protein
MTLEEAIDQMKYQKARYTEGLSVDKPLYIEAFKVFWLSNPSEGEFAELCNGMLVLAETIYFMVTNPIQQLTEGAIKCYGKEFMNA